MDRLQVYLFLQFHKGVILIRRNNWQRKECQDCKEYNSECRQGSCYIQKQESLKVKREKVDTS